MSKKTFGTTSKGVEASLYEISNGGGLRVLLTDYGASVVSIFVKDKDGNERDVILGYDNVKSYEKEYSYFGATVGRYANRIYHMTSGSRNTYIHLYCHAFFPIFARLILFVFVFVNFPIPMPFYAISSELIF